MASIPTSFSRQANYQVLPGDGLDGVVKVSAGGYYGTGTLLPTGRHILTAAHLFERTSQTAGPVDIIVTFDLPQGTQRLAGTLLPLPAGYRQGEVNDDLALVVLDTPAPLAAERYSLYRDTDEVEQTVQLVGYGQAATGDTGKLDIAGAPVKRAGLNTFDALGETLDSITRPQGWTTEPGSQLLMDFDNGTPEQDALGRLFGINDPGLGENEVFISSGDSGGPAFIDERIAGVATYAASLQKGSVAPDINLSVDSSFGEVAGFQRVSHHTQWIDTTVRDSLPQAPSRPEEVELRIVEGNAATTLAYFLVQLPNPPAQGASVGYRTVDGTAVAGEDYFSVADTLVLYPGESHAVVPVEIIGDTLIEGDETFALEIFNPRGGRFANGQEVLRAERTIVDDDGVELMGNAESQESWFA
ncbi:Calx-beta domain-containing protein [Halomonas sp. WWR20]